MSQKLSLVRNKEKRPPTLHHYNRSEWGPLLLVSRSLFSYIFIFSFIQLFNLLFTVLLIFLFTFLFVGLKRLIFIIINSLHVKICKKKKISKIFISAPYDKYIYTDIDSGVTDLCNGKWDWVCNSPSNRVTTSPTKRVIAF